MRIGKFAKTYDLSQDTVRYYISEALLTPEKINGQYDFDKRCEKQIREILELKKLKFTISEIKRLTALSRFKNLIDSKDNEYIKTFLCQKKKDLLEEKELIDEALEFIYKKEKELEQKDIQKNHKIGLPLNFLYILKCPECDNSLKLNTTSIDNNTIYNGSFECDCGYKAEIINGIIKIPGSIEVEIDDPNKSLEERYTDEISPEISGIYEKTINFLKKEISNENTNKKLFLEIKIGLGWFFSYFKDSLDDDSFYIISDPIINNLFYFKKELEKQKKYNNLIFISGDFSKLPIKNESLDYVFDIAGSTNYSFSSELMPIEMMKDKLKNGAKWFMQHIVFDERSKSLKNFESKNRNFYTLKGFKDVLNRNDLDYKITNIGNLNYTGDYVKVHTDGDKINFIGLNINK
ncbi:MAG: MerR family transcriptional regulator [Thermotogota bacterium]